MRAKDAPTEANPPRQLGLFAEALTESEHARVSSVLPAVLTKPSTPRDVTRSAAGRAEVAKATTGGQRTLPRLAVSPDEAAEMLGVSRDYFDEHVIGELRVVRRGRRILIAPQESAPEVTSGRSADDRTQRTLSRRGER